MAHFAKLDNDNMVLEVIRLSNEDITINGEESEERGVEILTSFANHSNWKQASYNKNFRVLPTSRTHLLRD